MKVVIQRSKYAKCEVNNKIVGEIDKGLVVLVSFTDGDGLDQINYIVKKILNLRIFDDENKVMNKSILDVGGKVLSISQFTLYAECSKGNRPSYIKSMNSENARLLYNKFNEELNKYIDIETGIFQADMQVTLINDGPVTIIIER